MLKAGRKRSDPPPVISSEGWWSGIPVVVVTVAALARTVVSCGRWWRRGVIDGGLEVRGKGEVAILELAKMLSWIYASTRF